MSELWRRLVVQPFRESQREARLAAEADGDKLDTRVVVTLLLAAVSLTLLRFVGISPGFVTLAGWLRELGLVSWAEGLLAAMRDSPAAEFNRLAYWSASCVVAYFVLPALAIKLVFRERLRDYGLKLRGLGKDVWLYGVLYLGMIPVVLAAARQQRFLATYPFYDLSPGEPLWPYFYLWELLYAAQFVALEFFFRGFLVHGTRRRLGYYSILVMMVPYCMIHFHKPMPEALAAIVAGLVLGHLSLKTRSIWWGAALHIGVAWLMDAAALYRKGLLG